MPSLGPEDKPGEGRGFGFQPIPLPALALKLRQPLNADIDVMQMLEDIRAIRALKRHQAQEHDHRQTQPQSVSDEIVGLAKRRIADDCLKVHRLEGFEEIDSAINVFVCALVPH